MYNNKACSKQIDIVCINFFLNRTNDQSCRKKLIATSISIRRKDVPFLFGYTTCQKSSNFHLLVTTIQHLCFTRILQKKKKDKNKHHLTTHALYIKHCQRATWAPWWIQKWLSPSPVTCDTATVTETAHAAMLLSTRTKLVATVLDLVNTSV
jgi:hypothetical protein